MHKKQESIKENQLKQLNPYQMSSEILLKNRQSTNNYVCFFHGCNYDEKHATSPRDCLKMHPLYVLSLPEIKQQVQELSKHIKIDEYDSLQGNLYKIILSVQETQTFIDALHFIPKLTDDSVQFQQSMYQKLKNNFIFSNNQNYSLLVLKNQAQLINDISRSVTQLKDQIYKFETFFNSLKQGYQNQISFLKFGREKSVYDSTRTMPKQQVGQMNFIKIEDDDDDEEQDKIEIQKIAQLENQVKQKVEINSQFGKDALNQDKSFCDQNNYIDLQSIHQEKEEQEKIVLEKQENTLLMKSIEYLNQNQDQGQKITQSIRINDKVEEIENLPGENQKSGDHFDFDEDNCYNPNLLTKKICKQKRVGKKQYQKKQQPVMKRKGRKPKVDQNKILISLNENQELPTFAKKCLAIQDIPTERNNEINGLIQQNTQTINENSHYPKIQETISFSKSTQLMTNQESISPSNEDKIIEDDDELEEEMQVIKKQNGQLQKVLITNYSWPKSIINQRKDNKSQIINQESYNRPQNKDDKQSLIQYNQFSNQQISNLDLGQQSSSSSQVEKVYKYNQSSQQKFIHFNKKGGLLILNQRNVILYTFKQPKVKKSRFEDLYECVESDEEQEYENKDSKKDQNTNDKELYQKKILFSNIKSAEIFEVFSSYYVLVMMETSGLIVIVKSNNFYKWKTFFRSSETATSCCSNIFNNSALLSILAFNTSQIKLFQIDLSSSKPKPKQAVSKFLTQTLSDGPLIVQCQGFWQIKRNSAHQVEIKNEIYFFIASDSFVSLYKTDTYKIECISQEEIQNFNNFKIFNLCGQVSLVAISNKEISIYNQQLKITTKIQANPKYGNMVDCFLPQEQSLQDLSLIIIQENCSFTYHCLKNKATLLPIPECYNITFYNQNQQQLISLTENSNSTIMTVEAIQIGDYSKQYVTE